MQLGTKYATTKTKARHQYTSSPLLYAAAATKIRRTKLPRLADATVHHNKIVAV
jgi:hypothetical protein